MARHRIGPVILTIILVLTLASALAVNPYGYGQGSNSMTIPLLKASVDPRLYPGDFLIGQRPFYYTYMWDALGLLHSRLGVGLPELFFGVYLVTIYFTFLGMYLIAFNLFESLEVGLLSMLFLLFSQPALASVRTLEPHLTTRTVAAPLLLFAIYYALNRETVRSCLLMGVSYLVHPLTTHYVLAMLAVAALVDFRRLGFRRLLIGAVAFLAVASPLLVWRHRHAPPSLHLFSADREWLVALHQRSSHHMFPFDWGWEVLVQVVAILLVFGIAWRHRNAEADDRHRLILAASGTIVGLCAAGVVGSELRPAGIVFLIQPLRAFQFMEYFAMLYVAHYVYRRLAGAERLRTVVGAVVAGWVVSGASRPIVSLLVLVGLAIFVWARARVWRKQVTDMPFVAAVTCLVCLAGFVRYAEDRLHRRDTFSIIDRVKPAWLDVQNWARTQTDIRDGFIVPPKEDQEFRVHGERTIYADYDDGGLMNSNPAFGREWLRRMRMLGSADGNGSERDFCALEASRIRRIAREMKATSRHVFLVWPCAQRRLPFPRKYRNDAYVVYEVG